MTTHIFYSPSLGGDVCHIPEEVYDATNEHWDVIYPKLTVIDDRLYLPGAAVFGSKIYLVGGWRADDDAYDDIK